jgi:hypothetical protein
MNRTAFLTALQTATQQLRATAQAEFEPLDLALLNHQPAPGSWSILECLEHLNRYSRYYNPQLAKALTQPDLAADQPVGYSWLGRKSVDMMRPDNRKKHTTLKHMNPSGSRLGRETLTEFLNHQTELLDLLARAHRADLNRKAMPVEFFKLLKLRLGEALEFVVVHQQRHLQQALRVKAGLQVSLAC